MAKYGAISSTDSSLIVSLGKLSKPGRNVLELISFNDSDQLGFRHGLSLSNWRVSRRFWNNINTQSMILCKFRIFLIKAFTLYFKTSKKKFFFEITESSCKPTSYMKKSKYFLIYLMIKCGGLASFLTVDICAGLIVSRAAAAASKAGLAASNLPSAIALLPW